MKVTRTENRFIKCYKFHSRRLHIQEHYGTDENEVEKYLGSSCPLTVTYKNDENIQPECNGFNERNLPCSYNSFKNLEK